MFFAVLTSGAVAILDTRRNITWDNRLFSAPLPVRLLTEHKLTTVNMLMKT
jgi:hypothetical protein